MTSVNAFVGIDLHQMAFKFHARPVAQDEAQRLLRTAIKETLVKAVHKGRQTNHVVTGCDLLNRMLFHFNLFLEIASETVMVVFVVPPDETNFNHVLPDYININPTRPLCTLEMC